MSTVALGRALQGLLAVLQGTCSSGTATVSSTEATGTVPAGSFGIPIIDGAEDDAALVMVSTNPATADGSWPVTVSGTAVAIESVQAGLHVNLPAGALVRWDPVLDGIEETSPIATGGLTGGTRLETFGAVRQVRQFKDLGVQAKAQEFFRCQLGDYPALVLSWSSTQPADGSTSAGIGPNTARVGRGKKLFSHQYSLFIVTSRLDSSDRRKREGDTIRDDLLELLTDREAFRGQWISAPKGVQVLDARLGSITPTSYIDVITFSCMCAISRREMRTYNDWLKTRTVLDRPVVTVAGATVETRTVDATDDMPTDD